MASVAFGIRCLKEIVSGQSRNCPYCGGTHTKLLQRKKVLLELRACDDCGLMFRYPKDSAEANEAYYQVDYEQGATTGMPGPEELAELIDLKFRRPDNDMEHRLTLLRQFCPRGRVLDFGCSWGYASWQMKDAGFDVVGFEVSRPRAAYARENLGIPAYSSLQDLVAGEGGAFDVIYSSHVLEHLPDLATTFSTFKQLLKPTGALLLFVPNCASRIARRLGTSWGAMISEKHCNALDARFLSGSLSDHGFAPLFAAPEDWANSDPALFKPLDAHAQAESVLPGEELAAWSPLRQLSAAADREPNSGRPDR